MMQRPIYEMLQTVSKRISLHMPALQGQMLFENTSYTFETTELPVSDDLYQPKGAIKEAEQLLQKSANTQASFMLQGGSTAGIHAMLLYACRRGDSVILPRNVHLSALSICAVAGIEPVFAELSELPGGWFVTSPEAYQKALEAHPHAKAVLVISSDYYGIHSNLSTIAKYVHLQGKLVLCDEAHGAYFNWRNDIRNAGAYGADLFVQSAHKTLPAVNPAAWLHAMDDIDVIKLRGILRMVQTSSPSFTLMQSLDDARAWMDAYGQEACMRLQKATEEFMTQASDLGFIDDRIGLEVDRLRLVLHAPQGGRWLQKSLQDMNLDIEMSDATHIVCILSLLDGEKRLQTLLHALKQIAGNCNCTNEPCRPWEPKNKPDVWPTRRLPISEAVFADTEMLKPQDATGRISAVNIGLYPPGIAWLTAGELITQEITDMIVNTPTHRLFGVNGGIRCVK